MIYCLSWVTKFCFIIMFHHHWGRVSTLNEVGLCTDDILFVTDYKILLYHHVSSSLRPSEYIEWGWFMYWWYIVCYRLQNSALSSCFIIIEAEWVHWMRLVYVLMIYCLLQITKFCFIIMLHHRWGRVVRVGVRKTVIGPDNCLSPSQRKAII